MATISDVRAWVRRLPEAHEHPSHGGAPAFRVGRKNFAYTRDDQQTLSIYVANEEEKGELIAAEPETFFTTSHYDGWAIVLVRLDAVTDDALGELLTEAWRLRAPATLRRAFDAGAQ